MEAICRRWARQLLLEPSIRAATLSNDSSPRVRSRDFPRGRVKAGS